MYFSAVAAATASTGKHYIGAATSPNVTGPYTPQDTLMILPPGGHGSGTVGADGFVQGNDRFIVFKNGIARAPEQTSHIALKGGGEWISDDWRL